jgi:threonine dehydrogenase-like Zn-dependent dehydrogenase
MMLVAAGFRTYVYSRAGIPNPKAAVTETIGATYVSSEVESVEQLGERVGNIDVVLEAAGSSQTAFQLLKVLATNGMFIFTGVPPRKLSVPMETDLIMKNVVLKNQVIVGTVNAGRESFESAVRDLEEFMRRWPDAVRSLITGRYPMEAFRDVISRTTEIKAIITIG